MIFLGYDLGSSSVKACLFDSDEGRATARVSYPDREMTIHAPTPGWAEQQPESWWDAAKMATQRLLTRSGARPSEIRGIGISYQMHGLVVVDEQGTPLRPSIIWCDSRAVDVGERAFEALGKKRCLETLLNSPGNFTASKLAWLRAHEPRVFDRVHKLMLPGDYLAFRLTGRIATTISGLSEGMFWDFSNASPASFLLKHYGIPSHVLADIVPTFGEQGQLHENAARELGLHPGTPVTYRAGDQPNNALSLNVLQPGEIAATAGTSGVVYGVSDVARADPGSRVNSFAHVNHREDAPRLGVLLCINGAGSSNRWVRDVLGMSYDEMNAEAERVSIGADGLVALPFGNGAERMLGNRDHGGCFEHLNFNIHGGPHLARAVQEGVAFSFRYGMDILGELGMRPSVIRAGRSNMFSSGLFRDAVTGATGVSLELYHTDGAEGAARGAAIGAGTYTSFAQAFERLEHEGSLDPAPERRAAYEDAYSRWLTELHKRI
jgi:xylulokinase